MTTDLDQTILELAYLIVLKETLKALQQLIEEKL